MPNLFDPTSQQTVSVLESQATPFRRRGYTDVPQELIDSRNHASESDEPIVTAKIAINSATLATLQALYGINLPVAKKIISSRPVVSFEDLKGKIPENQWTNFVETFDYTVVA